MIHKFSLTVPMRVLIPLLTGIGGIVVLVLFTIYQSQNALAEVEEEARHDLVLMMSSLVSSVNYLLHENDIRGVRAVLASQGSHPYIKQLVLADQAGIILAATGPVSDGLPLDSSIPELARVLTICRNDRMPGGAILGFDGSHLLGCYPATSSPVA